MIKNLWTKRCKLPLTLIVLSLIGIGSTSALTTGETVTVLILPFNINAPQDLSYLSSQIPAVMSSHLAQDGATTLQLNEEDQQSVVGASNDLDAVAELAHRYEASQIIWGSLTVIGDNFSIDARLLEPSSSPQPKAFSITGRGLENLLSVLNELARKISVNLFRREVISEVIIRGNQRIETDAIQRVLQSQIGGIFHPNIVSKDIKAIYNMGYFDDIKVESQGGPNGKNLIFQVKEKPTIRRIKFKGNSKFKDDEIKENLTINTGAILNIFKLRSNVEQIEKLYKGKNYHQVKIDHQILPLDNNQADLEFIIDEGPKIYVTDIIFEGNRVFDDDDLKDEIKTSEKGFFYWLTSSGDLDRATLDQDMARLNAFYQNHGYIRSRISDPEIDIGEQNITITIKIEAGPQFKVGTVNIEGDLIKPKEELLKKITVVTTANYDREKVRNDVIALTDVYSDEGYANSEIKPIVQENADSLTVDITYTIQKNQQVFFEKILIGGNTKTRDKVIRREMRVQEQELFNGGALKRSMRNLYRLDYFEDIKVDMLKGSADDQKILKIEVKEKPTGTFSFGAGYSSSENTFLMGSIAQRNLFGRGQILKLSGQLGSSTTRFDLSFTEPWLFDTRLSSTVEAYNQRKEVEDLYRLNSIGGGLRFSYPVFDYTRFHWRYGWDQTDVSEIEKDAPDSIKEREGANITSLIGLGLVYDSRDKVFNPTDGSKHSLSFEFAGLGGDVGYNKYVLDTGKYFPLFSGLIGFVHGKIGYVHRNFDEMWLPDYEKFYLGGINSLRGFGYRGVYISDTNEAGESIKTGGDYMVQLNAEIIFPIYEKAGVMGVVFYDRGNVYEDAIEWQRMRHSVGGGIRWFSPIAPIRIEYGHILDRSDEDDSSGRWEFTMGGAF